MGWSSEYVGRIPLTYQQKKDFISELFSDTMDVLKVSLSGNVGYVALKRKDSSDVFACVILTSQRDGEFAYKLMSDDMGPNRYECPKGILDILTPTKNRAANQWREICRKNLIYRAKRSALTRLLPGSQIEFKTTKTFTFGNGILTIPMGTTMILTKRYLFGTTVWTGNFNGVAIQWRKKHIPSTFEILVKVS